jgi:hypothetical protein
MTVRRDRTRRSARTGAIRPNGSSASPDQARSSKVAKTRRADLQQDISRCVERQGEDEKEVGHEQTHRDFIITAKDMTLLLPGTLFIVRWLRDETLTQIKRPAAPAD